MSRYRKTNHYITIDGETKLLCDWAEDAGISQELIRDRLKRGWEPDLAVHTPPRKYANRGPEPTAEHEPVCPAQEHPDGDQAAAD